MARSCATNIRQTAECYLSTVGTSKVILIQYVYVGSIRCLCECRTVYKCTIRSALPRFRMRHSLFAFRCKPDLMVEAAWDVYPTCHTVVKMCHLDCLFGHLTICLGF